MAIERKEIITFKVSSREKALIEKYAEREGCSVSDCIRTATFMDMVLGGYIEGIKYVGSVLAHELSKSLRSKFQRLETVK